MSKNLEFGFLTALASSHDFLSMIFGILGKFGIEIGDENFFGRKIFVDFFSQKRLSKFFGRKIFLIEKIFFDQKIFGQRFFQPKFFSINFFFEKLFFEKKTPTSGELISKTDYFFCSGFFCASS